MTCYYVDAASCSCDCPLRDYFDHMANTSVYARSCKLSVADREQAVAEYKAEMFKEWQRDPAIVGTKRQEVPDTPWGNNVMRQARHDNYEELQRQHADKERMNKLLDERPNGYDARMRVQTTHGTSDYKPVEPMTNTAGIFGGVMDKKIGNAILKCGPAFDPSDPDKDVKTSLWPEKPSDPVAPEPVDPKNPPMPASAEEPV